MKTTAMLFTMAVLGLAIFSDSGPTPATDPLKDPDKAAWELFVYVNQPVSDKLRWETWTHAARAFQPPADPPSPAKSPEKFELSKSIRAEVSSSSPRRAVVIQDAVPRSCSHGVSDGTQVMLNDDMVGYIRDNQLYSVEGQIAAVQKAAANKEEIQFPPTSIAVKAVWQTIDISELDQYYWRKCENSWYGLVALHISSKHLKNWFWTTFEHINTDIRHNQDQCLDLACVDTFGAYPVAEQKYRHTPQLDQLLSQLGPEWKQVWSHYRLIGTQVDFTNEQGKATLLGNSVLEKGKVATSSCITCHSRSAISKDKTRLLVSQSDGTGFTGKEDPCWYLDDQGQPKFYKLDYVWSSTLANDALVLPSILNCGKAPPPASP